jgi:hypothetical protein
MLKNRIEIDKVDNREAKNDYIIIIFGSLDISCLENVTNYKVSVLQ